MCSLEIRFTYHREYANLLMGDFLLPTSIELQLTSLTTEKLRGDLWRMTLYKLKSDHYSPGVTERLCSMPVVFNSFDIYVADFQAV